MTALVKKLLTRKLITTKRWLCFGYVSRARVNASAPDLE